MSAYREITLPGLVDLHVHFRDFAQSYKEDFESGSRAAIAGGVVIACAMPNQEPDLEVRPYNLPNMQRVHARARGRIYSDVGIWAAAQPHHNNVGQIEFIEPHSIGFKFYIEQTQGNDTQLAVADFVPRARRIHELNPNSLIAAHAEDDTIEETIGRIAGDLHHPLLIPHVNNRFLLDTIIKAKKKDLPVFAEACGHHLTMTEADVAILGWRARMKPKLGTQDDQDYLWYNIDWIDTFGTDHAPHTIAETEEADLLNPEGKTGPDDVKSFGVTGLEAQLFLLLKAFEDGKLTREQLVQKSSETPRRLIGLPIKDPTSFVRVSMEPREFTQEDIVSKCGWSPYIGRQVVGRVLETKLRGKTVYRNGEFVEPPSGEVLKAAA